jgi:hypothetical protein
LEVTVETATGTQLHTIDRLVELTGCSATHAERVYNAWTRNRYGGPDVFGIFHVSQIMAHSCAPNTVMVYLCVCEFCCCR